MGRRRTSARKSGQSVWPQVFWVTPGSRRRSNSANTAWSLCRRSITGDKNKAVEQLRAACREVLRAGPTAAQAPPAEEERFLATLSDAIPVDQEPGRWRLYEFHAMFPMAVGLARPAHSVEKTAAAAEGNLAQAGYRVVTWAIAVPAGEAQWRCARFSRPYLRRKEAPP